jgi:hypothetical protein
MSEAFTMSPERFSQAWGTGLVRATPRALDGVVLPESARAFLTTAGLPRAAVGFTFAFPAQGLPTLRSVLQEPPEGPEADLDRLRVIGGNNGAHVCIDEAAEGRLISAGPYRPLALLNSSVEQLAAFLLVFRDVRTQMEEAERAGMEVAVRDLVSEQAASPEDKQQAADRRRAEREQVKETMSRYRDQMRIAFQDLRAELARIDPDAMADEEGVWPSTIGEMEMAEGVTTAAPAAP